MLCEEVCLHVTQSLHKLQQFSYSFPLERTSCLMRFIVSYCLQQVVKYAVIEKYTRVTFLTFNHFI